VSEFDLLERERRRLGLPSHEPPPRVKPTAPKRAKPAPPPADMPIEPKPVRPTRDLEALAREVNRIATPLASYLLMWLWAHPEEYRGRGPR
jgi:hypothetical protein